MSTHEQTVQRQFDPCAEAYRHSAVHTAGPDLEYARTLVSSAAARIARGLDLGCGAGHLSFTLAPHVEHLVALDPSLNMLATVTRGAHERGLTGIEVHSGSAQSLPYPDGSFSLVCTRYSAHHWDRLENSLREMVRVLTPGGHALIIDVIAPPSALADTHLQAIELLRDVSHVRNRSVHEWRALLGAAGLPEGQYRQWPLRIEFSSWVARMRTPPTHVAAIRSLQESAPREVREALAIEADGSFMLQTGLFWLTKPPHPASGPR